MRSRMPESLRTAVEQEIAREFGSDVFEPAEPLRVDHGKIVTNHHVVEGMNKAYVVFSDGATKPVSRVAADNAQQDLIVLSVDTVNRSPVKFGDEMSLQQGDSVYALGAPEGLQARKPVLSRRKKTTKSTPKNAAQRVFVSDFNWQCVSKTV